MAAMLPADTYQRKQENDLTLGPVFEDLAIINLFLTLQNVNALAREIDEPTKFDDVVIRMTRDPQQDEYIYRQLKHKDTAKNSEQSITWNDLLGYDKRNAFCLQEYFYSFLKLNKKTQQEIRELSIATTVGFEPQVPTNDGLTELASIAGNLKRLPKKLQKAGPLKQQLKGKYYITKQDLAEYFDIVNHSVGTILSATGRRYKLSERGKREVAKIMLSSEKSPMPKELKSFLGKLVFDVNQPHVNDLRKINQSLSRIYFPFHWDETSQEKCFDQIKEAVLQCFKPILKDNFKTTLATWATVTQRDILFQELRSSFKKTHTLGSVKDYESTFLEDVSKKLRLENLPDRFDEPWAQTLKESLKNSAKNWDERQSLEILNIFNSELNATVVITSKVFQFLKTSSLLNTSIVIQVQNEESIAMVMHHFESLSREIHDCKATCADGRYLTLPRCEEFIPRVFCCVIEVSFCPIDKAKKQTNELIRSLRRLVDLRRWIQFVVVTQHPLEGEVALKTRMKFRPFEWLQRLAEARKLATIHESMRLAIGNDMLANLHPVGLNDYAARRHVVHSKSRSF